MRWPAPHADPAPGIETMNRRSALAAVLAAAAFEPFAAFAQRPGRTYRIGILSPTVAGPADGPSRLVTALRDAGYVAGTNLVVERRYADGKLDRLPALARELAKLEPDAIVVVGSNAARAVRDATPAIPVVFYGNLDPVATGLVQSFARPGGNLTGVLIAADGTLAAKRLEFLKQAVPRAARVAALFPDDPGAAIQLKEVTSAAAASGIRLLVTEVRVGDYERAFAAIAAQKPDALFVAAHTYFVRDQKPIIALAAKHRLPAIYEWPEQADAGGLMAYGSSLPELYRRTADYVRRILEGARPADMPVDQAATFELVVNLGTAKALGLTIPAPLLQRADRLIE